MVRLGSINPLFGCALALLFFPFLVGGCYGLSKVVVSEGFRDGTFRKLSDTGMFFTTTEAEFLGDTMKQDANGRFVPETFEYTIRDPEVKRKLAAIPPGTKVRVKYRKRAAVWGPSGESQYELIEVER